VVSVVVPDGSGSRRCAHRAIECIVDYPIVTRHAPRLVSGSVFKEWLAPAV
jgi:hypothetical protein